MVLEMLGRCRGASGSSGGRQWRLVDAYLDTEAEKIFHQVLDRGGVIGGSSAGATIQAGYLLRGSPLGNTEVMAEGYERGFGFLPGVAIDQHFSQRRPLGRHDAIQAPPSRACGLGPGRRHCADRSRRRSAWSSVAGPCLCFAQPAGDASSQPPREVLRAGDRYDFQIARVERDTTPPKVRNVNTER